MALIKCPDCEKEVSDKAKSCIHCGCPLAVTKTPFNNTHGSSGQCPACGSLRTRDNVKLAHKEGGVATLLGNRLGRLITGAGRFFCKDCSHSWN